MSAQPTDVPISVLVVEDHPVMLDGITALLQSTPDITIAATVSTAETAFEAMDGLDPMPTVGLLDFRLPDSDGAKLAAGLFTKHGLRSILFTAAPEAAERKAVEGVMAIIPKSISGTELAATLRLTARGHAVIPRPRPQWDPRLSQRELDVVRLLAHGLSNAEIAAELGLATETIKTYLDRIYTKLGVRNRTHAVRIAIEIGAIEA